MEHQQAVSFIIKAVNSTKVAHWADLGCGSGTFTRALAALLPPGSTIKAIDREQQHFNLPQVEFIRADMESDELPLTGLDGILIANAIHYIVDKAALIRKLELTFGGSPRFVLIEYDTVISNAWVPFPIGFEELKALFGGLGYRKILKLAERPSVYYSGGIYCALIEK